MEIKVVLAEVLLNTPKDWKKLILLVNLEVGVKQSEIEVEIIPVSAGASIRKIQTVIRVKLIYGNEGVNATQKKWVKPIHGQEGVDTTQKPIYGGEGFITTQKVWEKPIYGETNHNLTHGEIRVKIIKTEL